MYGVSTALFDHLLHNASEPQALFVVSKHLLLYLLRARVADVLSEYFEFFVTLGHLKFELTDLLLERHDKEGFLLVLLRSLCQRQETLV